MQPRFLRFAIPLLLCNCVPAIAAERVAALTNGNVLVGEIRQQADHVIISTRGSEIRLPAREVEMVKPNIQAVYQAKTAAIPRSRSRARSQLIRWCLKHQLREEARQELERLRRFDPDLPELQTLEKQLASFRQPPRTVLPSESAQNPDQLFAERQLSRLSKSAVAEFVNGIQPLLSNRCAQAGCHGKAASSSFSLATSRLSRVPRNTTHRNLGATLRRIGHYPSEQTLLWMSARSAHGDMTASPLSAAEQTRLLAWIQRVKVDLGGGGQKSSVVAASAEMPINDRVDPFDPEEFNKLELPRPTVSSDQAP